MWSLTRRRPFLLFLRSSRNTSSARLAFERLTTFRLETLPSPRRSRAKIGVSMASPPSTYLLTSKSMMSNPSFAYPPGTFARLTPNNDTFHSFTGTSSHQGSSSLLTSNNNSTSAPSTTNNSDDVPASLLHSTGHSLSQSMESINTSGLTDEEVSSAAVEKIATWSRGTFAANSKEVNHRKGSPLRRHATVQMNFFLAKGISSSSSSFTNRTYLECRPHLLRTFFSMQMLPMLAYGTMSK